MAFKFCHDDATRESYVVALFDCWNVQNIRVVLSNSHKYLPMGVIDFYFVDNEVEVCCRRKVVYCAYIICRQVGPLSLGCTTSAPDVSSPRGYGWVLVTDHRLQFLLLLSVIFFLSGAQPALPMGVATESIAEIFWV
jgi:hypothetical protein